MSRTKLGQMKTKKSRREKLPDSKDLPKIGAVSGTMTRRWGTGTMVIPAPKDVDAIMKNGARYFVAEFEKSARGRPN